MDLRQFIEETVRGIVDATAELQSEYEEKGVIINPPISSQEQSLYEHEDRSHVFRRVETIEFDVAVTAASETGGGGRAGLRVFSIEASADGKHARTSEEVSRVRFTIPIVLAPAAVEARNTKAAREASERAKAALSARRSGPNF